MLPAQWALKIQEKDELQWKKLKAEGMDEDGEREAKLRRNFNSRILFCVDMAFKELMKKLDEQFSFICWHISHCYIVWDRKY